MDQQVTTDTVSGALNLGVHEIEKINRLLFFINLFLKVSMHFNMDPKQQASLLLVGSCASCYQQISGIFMSHFNHCDTMK